MRVVHEMTALRQRLGNLAGWLAYLSALGVLTVYLPDAAFEPEQAPYWIALGAIGVWRYSLGALHVCRALVFMRRIYPRIRRRIDAQPLDAVAPFYLLITSYRIATTTTTQVYAAALREASAWSGPVTVVASIVELADEQLIKMVWARMNPPPRVKLRIVRIAGTGKRDALAHGFRAISRDLPPANALVAVIDGDTVLNAGVLERCAPCFNALPDVGALTTNEVCAVHGGYWMQQWHRMRFAQRHLNMCSMACSRRVLTLTGRMSMFRASIVTDQRFIDDVQNDALDHWRLGRFRFLTGDDKSSWFSLMKLGWNTWYVPDASITTVEHPPHRSFFRATRQLMFRWYGNSLRQNSRAMQLGRRRLGTFTTYVLLDQRISMWTCLLGLSLAIVGSLSYGPALLMAYLLWIGVSRLVLTAVLGLSGHPIGPAYPLLLYYNQIVGSLMKIDVSLHLDRQSWTRQPTRLRRELGSWQAAFNRSSSAALSVAAASLFASLIITLV